MKLYNTFYLLPLLLSGCMGIYEGGFECPPGEGTKCKSISEVNELVNAGHIPVVQAAVEAHHGSCVVGEELSEAPCGSAMRGSNQQIWWSPLFIKGEEKQEPARERVRERNHLRANPHASTSL